MSTGQENNVDRPTCENSPSDGTFPLVIRSPSFGCDLFQLVLLLLNRRAFPELMMCICLALAVQVPPKVGSKDEVTLALNPSMWETEGRWVEASLVYIVPR